METVAMYGMLAGMMMLGLCLGGVSMGRSLPRWAIGAVTATIVAMVSAAYIDAQRAGPPPPPGPDTCRCGESSTSAQGPSSGER